MASLTTSIHSPNSPARDEWQAVISSGSACYLKSSILQIIAPQYVKPYVRRQKNDSNDAEAICTALRQPDMRFVPEKTLDQQDAQALHRARTRLVNHRTALISQMRGLLLDRGIAIRWQPPGLGV